MKLIETDINGVFIIEPKVFGDARGYFFESWSEAKLAEAGIKCRFVQDNESKSSFGVLRGLHYQAAPYTQAKLVRVIEGKVLDVAVEHELYGQIRVDLLIETPQDAQDFSQRLSQCRDNPLKVLTDDCHYHTVAAPSEKLLDIIFA